MPYSSTPFSFLLFFFFFFSFFVFTFSLIWRFLSVIFSYEDIRRGHVDFFHTYYTYLLGLYIIFIPCCTAAVGSIWWRILSFFFHANIQEYSKVLLLLYDIFRGIFLMHMYDHPTLYTFFFFVVGDPAAVHVNSISSLQGVAIFIFRGNMCVDIDTPCCTVSFGFGFSRVLHIYIYVCTLLPVSISRFSGRLFLLAFSDTYTMPHLFFV